MTKRDPEVVKAAVASQRGMVERFFARLAEGNCAKPGITRDTYGEGENWGHRILLEHGERAGLQVRSDAAANTYVTLPGRDRAALVADEEHRGWQQQSAGAHGDR